MCLVRLCGQRRCCKYILKDNNVVVFYGHITFVSWHVRIIFLVSFGFSYVIFRSVVLLFPFDSCMCALFCLHILDFQYSFIARRVFTIRQILLKHPDLCMFHYVALYRSYERTMYIIMPIENCQNHQHFSSIIEFRCRHRCCHYTSYGALNMYEERGRKQIVDWLVFVGIFLSDISLFVL